MNNQFYIRNRQPRKKQTNNTYNKQITPPFFSSWDYIIEIERSMNFFESKTIVESLSFFLYLTKKQYIQDRYRFRGEFERLDKAK